MDKMREEFEAWAKTTSLKNFLFWHPSDNQYEVHAVQMSFEGWKASRSALCVELPADISGEYYADGWNSALSCVEGRLRECGVSFK